MLPRQPAAAEQCHHGERDDGLRDGDHADRRQCQPRLRDERDDDRDGERRQKRLEEKTYGMQRPPQLGPAGVPLSVRRTEQLVLRLWTTSSDVRTPIPASTKARPIS